MDVSQTIREVHEMLKQPPVRPVQPLAVTAPVAGSPAFQESSVTQDRPEPLLPTVPSVTAPSIMSLGDTVQGADEAPRPNPPVAGAFVPPSLSPPAASEAIPGPATVAEGSGGLGFIPPAASNHELTSLLKQLLAGQGQGGVQGQQRPGRRPPPHKQVAWSHVWEAPGEGFSSGASPSIDASRATGTGGASSRRGYGTYQSGSRFWQPDTDTETPR